MTDELVKQARDALAGVTPGPWVRSELVVGDREDFIVADLEACAQDMPEVYANARFIAAARELVPAMRDRIEADAKRIEELEERWEAENDAFRDALLRAEAAEARVKVLEDALRRIVSTSEAMSADYIYGGGEGGHERTAHLARAALEGEK